MEGRPQAPRATTAPELKAQIEAERLGRPFLVYRDGEDAQRILMIEAGVSALWIGRSPSADVELGFDDQVSTLHAQLEVVGAECTLLDDGLSTNGSFVNEERVGGQAPPARRRRASVRPLVGALPRARRGRPRLDRDRRRRDGGRGSLAAQKRVLVELCRPFKDAPAFATPATNQEIATALHLSVDAVKTHMRALFEKFSVEALPQNRKRVAVVERALGTGIIGPRDL